MTLERQFLLDLGAPLLAACLYWLLSRVWAMAIQRSVSEKTKNRQIVGFFVVLALLYALMFGRTTYYVSLLLVKSLLRPG